MLFTPALTDRATLPGEWRGEAIFQQNRPIADYGYAARLHDMAKSYVAFLPHRMSFFWRDTQIEQGATHMQGAQPDTSSGKCNALNCRSLRSPVGSTVAPYENGSTFQAPNLKPLVEVQTARSDGGQGTWIITF